MSVRHSTARLRREALFAKQIPYTAQVSEHVVRTRFGHYVQVLKLSGASFECADDGEINAWHERLNVLWRNLASANVALWISPGAAPGGELSGRRLLFKSVLLRP